VQAPVCVRVIAEQEVDLGWRHRDGGTSRTRVRSPDAKNSDPTVGKTWGFDGSPHVLASEGGPINKTL